MFVVPVHLWAVCSSFLHKAALIVLALEEKTKTVLVNLCSLIQINVSEQVEVTETRGYPADVGGAAGFELLDMVPLPHFLLRSGSRLSSHNTDKIFLLRSWWSSCCVTLLPSRPSHTIPWRSWLTGWLIRSDWSGGGWVLSHWMLLFKLSRTDCWAT